MPITFRVSNINEDYITFISGPPKSTDQMVEAVSSPQYNYFLAYSHSLHGNELYTL